jgi:hypothetical protein
MIVNEQFRYEQESDAYPTQGWGEIFSTGEQFYFRYRSGRVGLKILRTAGRELNKGNIKANFSELIDTDSDPAMPLSAVKVFLTGWINNYLAPKAT